MAGGAPGLVSLVAVLFVLMVMRWLLNPGLG